MEAIVRTVLSQMEKHDQSIQIPVEVSARHVHLSTEHAIKLFGSDTLENTQELSQPGQFLSCRRVRLLGPKGFMERVAVLGPIRGETQVEISTTDARALGIDAPVRLSGSLNGAANIHLQAGDTILSVHGAIIAQRHLHITPRDAGSLGLRDGQTISVRLNGMRPLILEDVAVRVSKAAALALHIDADEANAAGISNGGTCTIVSCPGYEYRGAPAATAPIPAAKTAPAAQSFSGKLLTETMASQLAKAGVREIHIRSGQIATPSALDVLRVSGIVLRLEGKE